MEVTRHFTSSVFVVFDKKVLLCLHRKLEKWLPLGGHIERDELPQEAAIREVAEESGLNVKLISDRNLKSYPDVVELVPPQCMLLEDITPCHQHIDFVFYGISENSNLDPMLVEEHRLKWFSKSEIKADSSIPADVSDRALDAISQCS